MLRTRVIPCLLLKNSGLVKTVKFKDQKYVGDPVNAVKIFNEKEVDELMLLDITSTPENKKPNFPMLRDIASECFMPLCYGGGICTIEDVKEILKTGVEKVCINTYAIENPWFIKELVGKFGSQSIIVSMDVRKNLSGQYEVHTWGGRKNTRLDPVALAVKMEEMGAGELLLTSIDKDGTQQGYDVALLSSVTRSIKIPVIACGGAGKLQDFAGAVHDGGASAVAAGSLFVFQGKHRAVLISYPAIKDLEKIFNWSVQ